jgi:hypothetical protein
MTAFHPPRPPGALACRNRRREPAVLRALASLDRRLFA